MSFVLDASMTLAAALPDENSDAARAVLGRASKMGAWVPAIWHLEVANALQIGARRGRCSAAFVDHTLERLASVPIEVDAETAARSWRDTLELARTENLTVYDAAYLELAVRRGLALASLDEQLTQAAVRCGVTLIDESKR